MNEREIKRGEIYHYDFGKPQIPGLQGGYRHCVVVQNDIGNKYSPTTQIAPLTSQSKKYIPTHVYVEKTKGNGLLKDSIILCEQIQTVPKDKLRGALVGKLNEEEIKQLDEAISISFGLIWKSISYL